MPTNFIRTKQAAGTPSPVHRRKPAGQGSLIRLSAGSVSLLLQPLPTSTAQTILRALPLFSKAEPWGACIHFRLPIASGRDRSARVNGSLGEV